MKTRRIILGTLIALVAVVLITTIAFAANSRQAPATSGSTGWETMHNSAAMRQVHDQMPAELRAQCDSMHAQMAQMHTNMGGVMGRIGTMGGLPMGGLPMGNSMMGT